nr:hypothetical protein L203_01982 [Cryptococcus depauperatus CBS 7841]
MWCWIQSDGRRVSSLMPSLDRHAVESLLPTSCHRSASSQSISITSRPVFRVMSPVTKQLLQVKYTVATLSTWYIGEMAAPVSLSFPGNARTRVYSGSIHIGCYCHAQRSSARRAGLVVWQDGQWISETNNAKEDSVGTATEEKMMM